MTELKKPVAFLIEAPKVDPGGGSGDPVAIQKAAVMMRINLMKFPGARSVANQVVGEETSIVISIKRSGEDSVDFPKELSYMDYKESQHGDSLAAYQLKDNGFKVFIKYQDIKVASMSPSKNKIGSRSPIKWTKKRKRSVNPAPGSPSKWPASGYKLPRTKNAPIPKATTFVVEGDNLAAKDYKTTARNTIKRAAIFGRSKLMSFPGARRLSCVKSGDSYAIVINTKIAPSSLPTQEYMDLGSGEYKLRDSGIRVIVKGKEQPVNVLRPTKKYKVKQRSGLKWTKKVKPAVMPEAAPETEYYITGKCKLVDEPAVKPKYACFFIDAEQKAGNKQLSPKCLVKKASIFSRCELMSFPNARRVRCQKVGDGYVINLYIKKGSTAKDLPCDLKYMNVQSVGMKTHLAEYLLKKHPYPVFIKEQPSFKVKALRRSKLKPGKVTGKKWVAKGKPSVAPSAAPNTETEWPVTGKQIPRG